MSDSWCKPVLAKSGLIVSGGAARNVRIAAFERGLDEIIENAARDAARNALDQADKAVQSARTPKLRVVK